VVIGGKAHSIRWAATHGLHDSWHHFVDIARNATHFGAAYSATATVEQLSSSDGGVPKLPIPEAQIGRRGVSTDRQADRKHHGRPIQALCLWSSEVIAALQAEGHPVQPGNAGENLTLSGLDWTKMRPGLLGASGDLRFQLTAPAVPCGKNNQWFAPPDSSRMDHDLHPGWSRWYAAVLTPGTLRQDDRIEFSAP